MGSSCDPIARHCDDDHVLLLCDIAVGLGVIYGEGVKSTKLLIFWERHVGS